MLVATIRYSGLGRGRGMVLSVGGAVVGLRGGERVVSGGVGIGEGDGVEGIF